MRKAHGRSGFKNQNSSRLQHDVRRPVPERLFVAIDDPALAIGGQAFGGNRRARDVAALAFQAAALVRLADRGGVERKARQYFRQICPISIDQINWLVNCSQN